ncbi:hypothetical protein [Kineococcus sp. SYSU DK018]
MDYLVCPYDQERVKVVEVRWGPQQRPLVDCPACARRYVFAETGLEEVAS